MDQSIWIDRRKLLVRAAAVASLSSLPGHSFAQGYPNQALKIVLPFSPGGSADRLCRLSAKWLGDRWQQPVVVETRLGATGMLGAELVAKSPADGYTILFTSTALVQAPIMTAKPLYVIERDFAPVSLMAGLSVVLVVRSNSDIRSLQDYIEAAKRRPGTISYGSIGPGSSLHVYGEALAKDAGIEMLHVPFRGEAAILNDLVAGHLDSSFLSVGLALEFIRAGTLRPLGVIGTKRSSNLPDAPTFVELGYKRHDALGWYGIMLPKETPRDIVVSMSKELGSALRDPEFAQQVREMGLEPIAAGPDEFAQFLREDAQRWRALITAVNMAAVPER